MASGAVQFLFDAIASLVALDESDGLLNSKAAFRSFEPQKKISNAPILLTVVVCARILQVLVSMLFSNSWNIRLVMIGTTRHFTHSWHFSHCGLH
jgi:hypothetical protein